MTSRSGILGQIPGILDQKYQIPGILDQKFEEVKQVGVRFSTLIPPCLLVTSILAFFYGQFYM